MANPVVVEAAVIGYPDKQWVERPLAGDKIIERVDNSLGMTRTEVLCANCESHLGHVFAGERGEEGRPAAVRLKLLR